MGRMGSVMEEERPWVLSLQGDRRQVTKSITLRYTFLLLSFLNSTCIKRLFSARHCGERRDK